VDYQKRKQIKAGLLQLCRLKLIANTDMIQLGDASIDARFTNTDPEQAKKAGQWTQIIQEFCAEHPQYSVVMWSGKPALTLTRSVEALPEDLRKRNAAEGFILEGGKFTFDR
jgi:hypothetical protein